MNDSFGNPSTKNLEHTQRDKQSNILENCLQDFGCDFDDSSLKISSKNVSKNFMVAPAEVSEYLCQSNSSDDRNNFDMVDALGEDDNDKNSENRDKMLLQNELNNLSNQSSDQALKKKLHLSLSKLKCESQMQQNMNGGCCLSNRIIHNQKVILNSARNLFNQNATQNHLSMLASLNNLSPTNKKQCTVFSSSPRKQKNQPFISNIMNRSFTNMR